VNEDIIGTNLIKDEVITFLNWKKSIAVLLGFAITSGLIVGAIFVSLVYTEKQKRESNQLILKDFNQLNDQIKNIEKEIDKIFLFQRRLELASQLFDQHIYWTNFFDFLEKNIIDDVYLFGFGGDTKGQYDISAQAKDFRAIAKQIKALRANNQVQEVRANGGSAISAVEDAGDIKKAKGVDFSLKINIDPQLFTD